MKPVIVSPKRLREIATEIDNINGHAVIDGSDRSVSLVEIYPSGVADLYDEDGQKIKRVFP